MKIKDIKAIKAAETLKQYCKDVNCSECIFYFRGDCMLSVINDEYDYTPLDWRIDLIKESWLYEYKRKDNLTVDEVIEE